MSFEKNMKKETVDFSSRFLFGLKSTCQYSQPINRSTHHSVHTTRRNMLKFIQLYSIQYQREDF